MNLSTPLPYLCEQRLRECLLMLMMHAVEVCFFRTIFIEVNHVFYAIFQGVRCVSREERATLAPGIRYLDDEFSVIAPLLLLPHFLPLPPLASF